MNHCFKKRLVTSATGGKGGGGASLTKFGKHAIYLYRTMEKKAIKASDKEWKGIQKELRK